MPDYQYKMVAGGEVKLNESGYTEVAFAQLKVIDHDGDVTLPGAFPVKDVPMSAYGHTSWDGALPVGKGTISEQGDWAVFKGQYFLNTSGGRDAYETVKGLGPLAEYSYGFVVPKDGSEPGKQDGQSVRFLKALDVFEVSPVLKGAGRGTHTMTLKSGGPGPDAPYATHLDWLRSEVEALVKRTDERAEWRQKEGRTLSTANRASLLAILEALDGFSGTAGELRLLLESTDPQKAKRVADIEVRIAIARSLGVPA